jgi:hypothetical protein
VNTLTFEISPSPSSNDHQVRIRIDGEDWLGGDYLGVDPPRFFAQATLESGGRVLVGRCGCGCEGCDDVHVDMVRRERTLCGETTRGFICVLVEKSMTN